MSDETTPGPGLRERIAAVFAHRNSDGSPSLNCYDPTHQRDLRLADAILAVVQPELDRRDAEIERLNDHIDSDPIARIRRDLGSVRALDLARAAGRMEVAAEVEPVVDQLLKRAVKAEAEVKQLREEQATEAAADCRNIRRWLAIEAERDQLKATVARVRALATNAKQAYCGAGWNLDPAAVLAALDGDLPAVREFAAKHDPREEAT